MGIRVAVKVRDEFHTLSTWYHDQQLNLMRNNMLDELDNFLIHCSVTLSELDTVSVAEIAFIKFLPLQQAV